MIDYPIISKILMRDNVPWFLTEEVMREIDRLWEERNQLRDNLGRECFWHELRKVEENKLEDKLQGAQNEIAQLQARDAKRLAVKQQFVNDFDKAMGKFLTDFEDADA